METRTVEFAEIEAIGRKAAAGDRAALDTLLVEARPLILGRCRRFLPNPLDAEEAAQDALLAIARRIDTFEGRSKFTTWMYQLTSNAAIDTYRRLKRRRSVLEAPPDLAAGGSTPSVIAGARIDVLDAAEKLDDRLVEPVFLRDLCELEYSDIAELLDIPVGTVKSRIHDGRAQLRHALYGSGDGAAGSSSHRRTKDPDT
jgi:RNA polymerase sigma-70 factor (ECF subfamily)